MHVVLIVGDLHFPWCSQQALKRMYSVIQSIRPTLVIQIGDAFDLFSFSRFPRSQNVIMPKDEIMSGRLEYEKFWRSIKKECSNKTKLIQMVGNHDLRIASRIYEKFPEIESLFDFSSLFQIDGVDLHLSDRQELVIDNICYMHGHRSKPGDHAKYNGMPTVCGHSHRGGVVFDSFVNGSPIFELNAGYLGDPNSIPLSYSKQMLTKWTHGFGVIDRFGPRFIPIYL